MSDVRVLLGSLLAGVGGAVVIAALVLGRGDAAPSMDLAALDSGGVLVIRVETYQRHGAKAEVFAAAMATGATGVYPERRVDEAWASLGPGGAIIEVRTVTWSEDGELLQRTNVIGRESITERPALGVLERETIPEPGLGTLEVLPSQMLAASRVDLEQRLAEEGWALIAPVRSGTMVIARTRPIVAGELEALALGGRSLPYYGDLDVTEIVVEETYTEDYWPISARRWAVLKDGSRVLVESRTFTIEARPAWEWRWFVARVWAD